MGLYKQHYFVKDEARFQEAMPRAHVIESFISLTL